MNFLKLNKSYNLSSGYKTFKSIASYGKNRNETFVGINYSMVATPDAELIYSVIPELPVYRDTCRVALCLQSRVHGFDKVKNMLGGLK